MNTDVNQILEDFGVNKDIQSIPTWTFSETVIGTAITIIVYLILVLIVLPAYMKNRQAYKLNGILMAYNAFQVAFSMYAVFLYTRYIFNYGIIVTRCPKGANLQKAVAQMVLKIAFAKLRHNDGKSHVIAITPAPVPVPSFHWHTAMQHYCLAAEIGTVVVLYSPGNLFYKVIDEIWPYFLAKHLDLLDTVFFVLRKKETQVTFLHVYHHSAMVTWTWFHLMFYPTDHFNIVGLINSFIHVIMYTYYGLSSLGPKYAKFLWWKKHLTKIQLVQFILVLSNLHFQQKLSPCPIPSPFHYYCLFCISSFFFLFMNFYFRNYGARIKKSM